MAEESEKVPQAALPGQESESWPIWTVGVGLIPVALLIGAIVLLLTTRGAGLLSATEGESGAILFDRTVLQPGQIALHIRNSSTQAAQILNVNINDAILPFVQRPAGAIPPFGSATVYLLYPWVRQGAYTITLYTGASTSFRTSIDDAEATPPFTGQMMATLLLIGLAAGLLPVLCGITWFPAVTRAGTGFFLFLLAAAGGLLAYLGIELADETLENITPVSGAFQGIGLLAVNFALTILALNAVSGVQSSLGARERPHPLAQTWLKSSGVGLQNLALTLAAGAAFSSGAIGLGSIFIIALILLNITQGLRIMAAMENHAHKLGRLLGMAFVAGAPGVLGIWLGGTTTSQMAFLLLYAIGAGAVVQALYELIQRIRQGTAQQPIPVTIFAGFASGILALYLASLLIG